MPRCVLVLAALGAAACAALPERAPEPAAPSPAVVAAVRASHSIPIRDRFAKARLQLLRAINAERIAARLAPVTLDSVASLAAQRHAEAMAAGDFFSHYDLAGRAPYERLAALGGTGHVVENVFRREERTEDPLLDDDPWRRFDPREAHAALMASPPHQAAILDPYRTGVGLGFAVDRHGRSVFVVEEFVARHATLTAPASVASGRNGRVVGQVLAKNVRPLAIVLRKEPLGRSWSGGAPPAGPYDDGGSDPRVVPPWAFVVRADGAFVIEVGRDLPPGRWYGVLYVAPDHEVDLAMRRRRAYTGQGWPGAAFLLEVRS